MESPPLELVQGGPVLPLTLQLGADSSDAEFAYRADRSSLALRGDERGEVVFVAEHEGRQVEKRYSFTGAAYDFEIATRISDPSPPPSVSLVLTAMPEGESGSGTEEVALAFAGKRLIQKPMGELRSAPVPVEGAATWAGFAAQYFLIAAVAGNDGARAVMTTAAGLPLVQVEEPLVSGRASFTLYAGPKEREKLAEIGHDLGRALDFGWFWFVAVPLLQALRALQRLTGNYGIAIILLTTLVKVATIPLTQTTFRNMREMQKIQPQMKKLQEKFKDDRVALQREMMELYRRHRVNPLSGCLPMVLQLPIFVGLYNALMHAIELRHAPFVLWIDDLSAPDRLMVAGVGVPVLTLLMGASMLLQQRLTPAQGDPMQQRMMMFMPLVFTFMFINFPAGLVLYWLVNNVLSIGHQYVVMRPTKRGSTS
jgi:YidC/Oxa1 family membrane protein insertase